MKEVKNVSQSYYEYIYSGAVDYDNELAYEYNYEWEEEVRRMRDNKTLNNKKERNKNEI